MIIAGIASIPERRESLVDTVESLAPQVDRVVVSVSSGHPIRRQHLPDNVQILRGNKRGDAGKYVGLTRGPWEYYLSCDDDLIYPPDYAAAMVAGVEKYGRGALVTLHGGILRGVVQNYFRGRTHLAHCLTALAEDTPINVGGTGVMAFHRDTMPGLVVDNFQTPNVADIWMGVIAQTHGVPMVALEHGAGWVVHSRKVSERETLFHKYHRSKNYPGNDVVKRVRRWQLYPLPSPAIP